MKKFTLTLLASLMALSLTACDESKSTEAATSDAEAKPDPTEAATSDAEAKPDPTRARFNKMIKTDVYRVQKYVELCIFDLGTQGFKSGEKIVPKTGEDGQTCSNGQDGSGWLLKAETDYANEDVASIKVANGVITTTAVDQFGLKGATITLEPHFNEGQVDNGIIDWKRVDAESTCIQANLC